jgi:hypothetical protein
MSQELSKSQKKTSLFKIGTILFPAGLVLNILFMKLQVHGILRELSRLSVLVGFLLLIFGGIYQLFKKNK